VGEVEWTDGRYLLFDLIAQYSKPSEWLLRCGMRYSAVVGVNKLPVVVFIIACHF